MSSACTLVTPKPLKNWCLWIAHPWCTYRLKCYSYSQDWAGVLAGAYSSSSDPGGHLALQSGQHRSTKNRLCGKIFVSHICPNPCQTPQTGNGSADLGSSFQSTEFISPMACTVSLQIQWDWGQPLCCGTKRWKSFPSLQLRGETGDSSSSCWGLPGLQHSNTFRRTHCSTFQFKCVQSLSKTLPWACALCCLHWTSISISVVFSKQQLYSPSWPESARAWLAVQPDSWHNQRNP